MGEVEQVLEQEIAEMRAARARLLRESGGEMSHEQRLFLLAQITAMERRIEARKRLLRKERKK